MNIKSIPKYIEWRWKCFKKKYLFQNESDYEYWAKGIAHYVGEGVLFRGDIQVNDNTYIGEHTVLNGTHIIGGGECRIGRYCHLAEGLKIITSNHNYKGNGIPYEGTDIEKPVTIGDFVWIGANVTILPGVTIQEGAIIQAGSVVRNEVPYCAIVGGNPAQIFQMRDVEHYEQMKKEERFF